MTVGVEIVIDNKPIVDATKELQQILDHLIDEHGAAIERCDVANRAELPEQFIANWEYAGGLFFAIRLLHQRLFG